ncbi:MAG: ABC transporter permease [Coriobacteriales bacterium]|jgi:ABC-2 type transport system permease protein|nr:ABC transporter permease [Coriobacteriales bacterium]
MFSIFIEQQMELWRNKGSLFFIVLFPTLLVFILGTMLSNLDNPDETVVHFQLGYVIDTNDPAVTTTAEAIINQFVDVEQISFTRGNDLGAARQQLAAEELGAVVVFRSPFAVEILEGRSIAQNRAVRAIFEGVTRLYGTLTVVQAAASAPPAAAGAGTAAPGAAAAASLSTAEPPAATGAAGTAAPAATNPLEALAGAAAASRVEEQTYGVSRTMIDYYAITMIVMMFLMGSATSAASQIYQSRKDGTLRRLLASPISRVSIYLQTLAANIPVNILQVGIVMLASTLFLGAHYAATWQLNVLLFTTLFAAGFATSAIFLALGIFIRFSPWPLFMPVMWVLLFLSGSFSKEIYVPGLTELMPPRIIQNAAFELTLFGHTQPALNVLLVSLGLITLSAVVGSALFRRKEVAW